MRGSSRLINSCSAGSSSAKRIFSPLSGLAFFMRLGLDEGQCYSELTAASGSSAGSDNRAAMILDDAIRNREAKACALTITTTRKKGFEQVFLHFRRHAATVV